MSTKFEQVNESKLAQPEAKADKGDKSFAASWYIAMYSKDLGKKPKAIELFGRFLVAWRDQKGHPVIMDTYCSHMGASLAIGKVIDGCLQCPFHHWCYDSSGKCVHIPEVDHIPPRARQTTYITAERYGYIWVWYGSEIPLFPLPEFPAAEKNRHNYMPFNFANKTTTSVLRALENSFDYFHVATLHGQEFSGPIQVTLLNDQYSEQHNEPPIQKEACFRVFMEFPLCTLSDRIGGQLGQLIRLLGFDSEIFALQMDAWPSGQRVTAFLDGEESFKMLISTIPVNKDNTVRNFLLMVKKTGKFWIDIPQHLILGWQSKTTSDDDLPVFNTMKSDWNGVYVKHDLVVLKFRDFYQSWLNKVDLTWDENRGL